MPPKKRSRLGRHTAAAAAQKAIIANESSDKKAFRLSQSALRSAQSRAAENLQQHNARLAKMASYDAAYTASDGPETRSKRSAIKASAVAAQRASEDPQQRATRLATNAAATAASTFSTHSHDSDQQRSTFKRNSRRRGPDIGTVSYNRDYYGDASLE
ncbi:Hypothetical predicted protein [Octopus vulgaris]|uniref:STPR domain-containing protein n=1 Tax=Octopus vulgaris TaxID=6645 RepID=A0AA36B214_OCTVU|nr:Hypothetical predicted protein [Octopus vulgaris]